MIEKHILVDIYKVVIKKEHINRKKYHTLINNKV